MTESQALIGMPHNYWYMWPRILDVLVNIIDMDSGPKVRIIICNYELESAFNKIKKMFSSRDLFNYLYFRITLTLHTYSPDKQLGDVTSQNNKSILFLLKLLSKRQVNYTMTEKEIV